MELMFLIVFDLKFYKKILEAFCVVIDFENENPFIKEGCFSES